MKCERCNIEMKLVPQGVSKKTNKPYKAFFSCPNRCGTTAPAFAGSTTPAFAGSTTPAIATASNSPSDASNSNNGNGWQVIVEHLTTLEKKVDELTDLLKEQLSL